MLGLVMIMGLYYALTAWLINRLAGGRPATFLLVAPAVWVAVEWIRGWFLSGFPWMSLGYSQIDSPLAGLAPVVGVYGLSLALVLSVSALIVAVVSAGRYRTMAAALAVLPWIIGAVLQPHEWTEVSGKPVRTTIIQGGISQEQKWLRDQFWPTLNLYRSSIRSHPDSELIVWPEVALPALIDQVENYLSEVELELRASGQSLLLGILERQAPDETIYNSMMMIGGDTRQVYRNMKRFQPAHFPAGRRSCLLLSSNRYDTMRPPQRFVQSDAHRPGRLSKGDPAGFQPVWIDRTQPQRADCDHSLAFGQA